jgi:hypothetical protein
VHWTKRLQETDMLKLRDVMTALSPVHAQTNLRKSTWLSCASAAQLWYSWASGVPSVSTAISNRRRARQGLPVSLLLPGRRRCREHDQEGPRHLHQAAARRRARTPGDADKRLMKPVDDGLARLRPAFEALEEALHERDL